MQHPALTPQQEAIRQVRERYERGDLSFDRFEYALNALLQARTTEECQGLLQELPVPATSALDVLSPPPAPPAPRLPRRRWIVGILGEIHRLKRTWRMGQRTTAVLLIGELELDLSLANPPPGGVLEVYMIIGEAKLYVPRDLHVSVHAFTLLGETKAFGESREGIFAYLNDEEAPAQEPSDPVAPRLDIRVFSLIGEIEVKQVDAPVVTISKEASTPPMLPQPQ
jgi:Cell wall-active antibiotics response LiaF, C-terminal